MNLVTLESSGQIILNVSRTRSIADMYSKLFCRCSQEHKYFQRQTLVALYNQIFVASLGKVQSRFPTFKTSRYMNCVKKLIMNKRMQ